MNQNVHSFPLSGFLTNLEGWGSKAGAIARRKLQQRLDLYPSARLFRISMSSVRRLDVTFASQAIAVLVRNNIGRCSICLIDLSDEDIIVNITAGAQRTGVPVTIWNGIDSKVVGPTLSPALAEALGIALGRPTVHSAELAQASAASITSASTRLKALWARGYLMREERPAASGGMEFVYQRIG